MKQLESSEGYVTEKRMKKESVNLYADPSQLDREARLLQRYMMQFSQLEVGSGTLKNKQDKVMRMAKAQRLKRRAMNMGKPKKSPRSTMGQSYHKDDAYEQALEEAELRLETCRLAKMQEVGNQEEEEVREETPVKNKGKGKGKSSISSTSLKIKESPTSRETRPSIEIVMDDDVDDIITLQHHYGNNTSLSRMDTFILPSKREPRDEMDDTMSSATSTSFMSFDGKLYVPPDVKKLSVNKDTGETIMHKVARLGKEDIALWLCQTGFVNVKKCDHAGYTGLHESSATGHVNISKILLSYGLDVNAASRTDGIRPLHDAIENDHIEMARLLLSYGADSTLSTFSGKDIMRMIRSKEMREFLCGYLVDVNGPTRRCEREIPWFMDDYPIEPEDEHEVLGFNMWENVPPDQDADDVDMLFECSEEMPVSTHFLTIDEKSGPSNYALLLDVLKHMNITKDKFLQLSEDIPIFHLTWDQLAEQMSQYTIPVECPWMQEPGIKSEHTVDVVPWNEHVQRLLGVQMECVEVEDMKLCLDDTSLDYSDDRLAGFEETEVELCELTTEDDESELQVEKVRRAIEFDDNQNFDAVRVDKANTSTKKGLLGNLDRGVSIQMVELTREESVVSVIPGPSTTSTPHKVMTSSRKGAQQLMTSAKSIFSPEIVTISDCDTASDANVESDSSFSIKIAGVCSLNTDDAMTILGTKLPFTPPRAPTTSTSESSDLEMLN